MINQNFNSTCAGIPCQIEWEWDEFGWFSYTVLDRRGRPAPWLERKAAQCDVVRWEDEAAAQLAEEF
jgi:hypothetical protein